MAWETHIGEDTVSWEKGAAGPEKLRGVRAAWEEPPLRAPFKGRRARGLGGTPAPGSLQVAGFASPTQGERQENRSFNDAFAGFDRTDGELVPLVSGRHIRALPLRFVVADFSAATGLRRTAGS